VETGKKPWKWGRKSSGKGKWNGIWKKLSIAAVARGNGEKRVRVYLYMMVDVEVIQ
jgi:hypothetical protein